MTDPSGGGNHGGGGGMMREYRKGNWTVSETMVLIEAKKMDDERRLRRSIGLSAAEQHDGGRSKPAELRWKWIEDYCWRKGCLRSQNQCNDKWDNLMRDYKKVREYERRRVESSFDAAEASSSSSPAATSYWKMEKSERKERNLPSNMLSHIYDALVDVVEKKGSSSSAVATAAGSGNGGGGGGGQIQRFLHQPSSAPMIAQPKHQIPAPVVLPLPPPPQLPVLPLPQAQPPPRPPPPPSFHAQPILPTTGSTSSDSDTSESLDTSSPAKRMRRTAAEAGPSGTAAVAEELGGSEAVGEAISRSASVIAEAIRASEERQDKRHRELVSLQERRLKIEESKAEMNRQSMNGLVDAIHKLSSSIFALASSHHHQHNNQHQGGPP